MYHIHAAQRQAHFLGCQFFAYILRHGLMPRRRPAGVHQAWPSHLRRHRWHVAARLRHRGNRSSTLVKPANDETRLVGKRQGHRKHGGSSSSARRPEPASVAPATCRLRLLAKTLRFSGLAQGIPVASTQTPRPGSRCRRSGTIRPSGSVTKRSMHSGDLWTRVHRAQPDRALSGPSASGSTVSPLSTTLMLPLALPLGPGRWLGRCPCPIAAGLGRSSGAAS